MTKKTDFIDLDGDAEAIKPKVGAWVAFKYFNNAETLNISKCISLGVTSTKGNEYEVNMAGEKEIITADNMEMAKEEACKMMRQKLLMAIDNIR